MISVSQLYLERVARTKIRRIAMFAFDHVPGDFSFISRIGSDTYYQIWPAIRVSDPEQKLSVNFKL
jgi:hypothetical protein